MRTNIIRHSVLPLLAIVALTSSVSVHGWTDVGHKWATTTISYYVNPQSIYVSPNAAISAVQQAAAGWSQQSHANVQLVYAGTTTGTSLTLNSKNEVFFRNGSNGGNVAETYYWWDGTGKLVDADIVFYEGSYHFYTGSGCSAGIYVENVAIHEFGHVLGLGHTAVRRRDDGPLDVELLRLDAADARGRRHRRHRVGVSAVFGRRLDARSASQLSVSAAERRIDVQPGAELGRQLEQRKRLPHRAFGRRRVQPVGQVGAQPHVVHRLGTGGRHRIRLSRRRLQQHGRHRPTRTSARAGPPHRRRANTAPTCRE